MDLNSFNDKVTVDGEQETMYCETAVAYFKMLSQPFHGEAEERKTSVQTASLWT